MYWETLGIENRREVYTIEVVRTNFANFCQDLTTVGQDSRVVRPRVSWDRYDRVPTGHPSHPVSALRHAYQFVGKLLADVEATGDSVKAVHVLDNLQALRAYRWLCDDYQKGFMCFMLTDLDVVAC